MNSTIFKELLALVVPEKKLFSALVITALGDIISFGIFDGTSFGLFKSHSNVKNHFLVFCVTMYWFEQL